MSRLFSIVMVFLSGGVCFLNLSAIKYSEPAHYEASWGNVLMAITFACFFGVEAALKGAGE